MMEKSLATVIIGLAAAVFFAVSGFINPALREGVSVKHDAKEIANGTWSAAFGRKFDNELWLRKPSIEFWTIATYGLLREGRDGVLVGRDGWFYTKEEFAAAEPRVGIERAVAAALDAKRRLGREGAQFAVLVVPAKARIYPDFLGRHSWPQPLAPVYSQFVEQLRANGVAVIDARPAMAAARGEGLAFFRTDTHWTPLGAEAVAKAAAKRIVALGLTPALPGQETSTIRYGAPEDHAGDLLNFVPLGGLGRFLTPKLDTLRKPVLNVTAGDGDASSGLLGDDAAPVVLVGTSYSANEKWGFAAYLEHYLRAGVVNVSDEGTGPYPPLARLLEGGLVRESRPALVLWEFPERDIWHQQGEGAARPQGVP